MPEKTLGELAEYVGGEVCGDSSVKISYGSTLGRAEKGDITFLANEKYTKKLKTTKASAIVVGKEFSDIGVPLLISKDPYYAFMQIMVLLHGHRKHKKIGVSGRASISDSAEIGVDCQIHNFVTIEDNAKVGDNCIIYPCAYIGENVQIGCDCIIYPSVTIYNDCKIGDRVILNANSTVGEDGFGFASHDGTHHKIPQIGSVIIEDDVEIGTCCAIERGTLSDTVLGKGSKLGDLVTIGHGTKVGDHCLFVAQVGIAGSTTIGHHCVLGGQVGIVGHIKIGNMVKIGAQSGVINNVADDKKIFGSPAISASKAKRSYSLIGFLPEMRKSIRKLEKRIDQLQKPEKS